MRFFKCGDLMEKGAKNINVGNATSDSKSTAKIALEDGTIIKGEGFGHETTATGEIVFSTGMTGYVEGLNGESSPRIVTVPEVTFIVNEPGVEKA